MTVPLAVGCRLEPSPDLRSLDQGRILVGGAPLRILRLQPTGADLVRGWFAGDAIGDEPAHQQLARRLEHNGMARLRWPATEHRTDPSCSVVIPSRDDHHELARTLASGFGGVADEVIVVDDGSTSPIEIPNQGPSPGPVTLIRRERAGGPGAARQTGLEAATSEVVVFLDSGVTLAAEDARGLLAAFADPSVVAAAPRVRSEDVDHLVGRYDRHRSPLDLGPSESIVGPGRMVTYVPTACLAVRADALAEVGGFDPDLRYGEDVDLVWRLGRIGTVRYLPELTAVHRPRSSVRAMLAQRRDYGSSAALLAQRHGAETLAPCRVSPWTALVTMLAVAGRPGLAAMTAVGTGLALRPKLEPMPDARVEALNLTIRGHWYGGLSILTATGRAWAPLLVPLVVAGGKPRRLAATLVAGATLRRAIDGPRGPRDAAIDLGLGLADDLASCVGLWQGAAEQRSTAALRPVLASWPGGGPTGRARLVAALDRVRGRR